MRVGLEVLPAAMPHHHGMQEHDLTALAVFWPPPSLCGVGMSRMRLPAAAGFILVGLALGPSGRR